MLVPEKLGIAGGILWAAMMFIITLFAIWTGYATSFLGVMASIYPGYTVSLAGSLVGLLYGFIDGFVFFYLLAWIHNKIKI